MYKFGMLYCLLLAASALVGQGVISGQITDADGESLPGASVYVLESENGTVANENGVYKITGLQPGNYTLRFSFVGYERVFRKTSIVDGTAQTLLHVQLEDQTFTLEDVVLRATRVSKKGPFTFQNLDKKDLEDNDLGPDMPYLLQWTPGAVVTSDAGTGIGYTGIRIRGTDPTRINVTINGIPLNDAESQGVFWVNLPDFAASVDDIQIQRGVGTSTNGPGAFGATINLNTNSFQEEAFAELSGSVGSFNSFRGSVQFGTGLLAEKYSLEGRLSRITSDGYVDRATADLESFYLAGAYKGENSLLRLNVFSGKEVTYQSWFGVPGSFLDDPDLRTFNLAGQDKPGEPYENEVDDYTQTHYQAHYAQGINRNLQLNLALHYTRGYGFFEQYVADQSYASYGFDPVVVGTDTAFSTNMIRQLWLDNHFYGTTYALDYSSNGTRFRATLGGAWNQYLGKHFGEVIWASLLGSTEPSLRYYENDATKNDFNIFLKAEWELTERLGLFGDVQYRQVDYAFLGFNRQLENVEQTVSLPFINPKAGLSYQYADQGRVYASFAVGQREPSRDDYVNTTPESRPDPEQLYDFELGLRQDWKRGYLHANLYYMQYRNQLVLTGALNDVGAYTRMNVPNSFRRGVEIDGGLPLLDWLQVAGNVGFSQNIITAHTERRDIYNEQFEVVGQEALDYENSPIAFSPNVVAGLILEAHVLQRPRVSVADGLRIALLHKFVSKQYLDNTGDEAATLDAYGFSDLRFIYTRTLKNGILVALNGTIRNLQAALYESNGYSFRYLLAGDTRTDLVDPGYYPQAGRNFLLGITFKW